MNYALDTEFIDTPACSALMSLAVVRQDGESRYYEFDYPKEHLTPWLLTNVVPHMEGGARVVMPTVAAVKLAHFFVDDLKPKIWAYCGGYDWYFFCRIFGGFMTMPPQFDPFHFEFARIQRGVPDIFGPPHNALNDARSLMAAMNAKGV